MPFRTILLLCAGVILNCCSAQLTGAGGSTSTGGYSEDLSGYRPKYTADSAQKNASTPSDPVKKQNVTPTLNVNQKVDAVLDSIDELHQIKRFIDGYTIQIYSGTNKEDAMNAKKKMAENADNSAVLQYNQPKFRVTTGSYYTRLEAQRDLMRLKKIFPNCILVPEKVPIR